LGTGHFALLAEVHEEQATIIDLTLTGDEHPGGLVEVHKARLRNVWKGEAILLTNSAYSRSHFSTDKLAVSAVVLAGLVSVAGVKTYRRLRWSAERGRP
jgi:hypothetical protein